MVEQQRLRPLVEGALMAAITAVFGMISLNFPVMSFLTDFLWGIPIIVVFIRHDWRIGTMSLTVAALLTLMLTEPVMAGLLFIQLAPVAVVYGMMFKKKYPAGQILLSGTVVTLLAEAVVLFLLMYVQRNVFHFGEELNRQAQEVVGLLKRSGLMEYYRKNGVDEAALKQMIASSIMLLPGSFILAAGFKAVLTYFVSARVLERLSLGSFRLPPFGDWHLPWYASWSLLAGLLLTLAGDQYGMPVLATVGKNIVFICFPIFFIIGLAVAVHFFRRWMLAGWVKTLLIIIAVLNFSGTILLLTGLGIFDPLIAFRARGKTQDQ